MKVTFRLGWKENSWHPDFLITEQLTGKFWCVPGDGVGQGLGSLPFSRPPSVSNNRGRSLDKIPKRVLGLWAPHDDSVSPGRNLDCLPGLFSVMHWVTEGWSLYEVRAGAGLGTQALGEPPAKVRSQNAQSCPGI